VVKCTADLLDIFLTALQPHLFTACPVFEIRS